MAEERRAKVPLTDAQARGLLASHEIVRDPIHRDISITALERRIIDTEAFQRLRFLYQLGPTHLVYPGAVHSRFLHSLGTLHYAEKLVGIVNRNHAAYEQQSLMSVEPYPHLLVRLCALLHDVAHMPFGHTLEDEGNLKEPEWEDEERVMNWLGKGQEIPGAVESFLKEAGVAESSAKRVVDDARQYVLCRKPGELENTKKADPMELEYPFVVDLVGNTLCADLLDYLDRDMYFCGLNERGGDRVINYVSVVRVCEREVCREDDETKPREFEVSDGKDGKGRVVLLAYRFEHEHTAGGKGLRIVPQSEILSEAIDLLRRRYLVAEKVYFHRTKIAASAMIVSAMKSSKMRMKEVYGLSDAAFISMLKNVSNPRTVRLIGAFEARRLYKPVYRINYIMESDENRGSKELWRVKYPLFRDPNWRDEKERFLEECADLKPGSISIYCPDKNMNLKRFEMLVQTGPEGEIKSLEHILDEDRRAEMDAINRRFPKLWRLQVFVDPEVLDATLRSNEAVQDLSRLCEDIFGFQNDIEDLRGTGRPLRQQVAARVIQEWHESGGETVTYDVFEALMQAPQRSEPTDLRESLRSMLRSLMERRSKSESQGMLDFEREDQ